jgi:hypothetical protein
VLALDFAETDFLKTHSGRRGSGGLPARGSRRGARPTSSGMESTDKPSSDPR